MSEIENNGPLYPLLKRVLDQLETDYSETRNKEGASTGFDSLDSMCGKLSPGSLWVITGRPAMGKTALATAFTWHAGVVEKKKVAVFSGDHKGEDFVRRMLVAEAKIPFGRLREGQIDDQAWPRLVNTAAVLSEAPVKVYDFSWISIPRIRQEIEKHQYDVVVIDKFHSLILRDEAAEGANNRTNELNQAIIELKKMAKELNFALVLLCDINKGQEQRSDKRPMLVDLKDYGGVLESYADVVLGMFTPSPFEETEYYNLVGMAEIIFLKNRFGVPDTVRVRFVREFMFLSDIAHEGPDATQ